MSQVLDTMPSISKAAKNQKPQTIEANEPKIAETKIKKVMKMVSLMQITTDNSDQPTLEEKKLETKKTENVKTGKGERKKRKKIDTADNSEKAPNIITDIEKGEGAYEVQGKAAKAKIQPELNWNCIFDDMPSISQAAKKRLLYYEAQVKELKKYDIFSHTIADISKQPLTLKGNSGQLPIKGIEKEHNEEVFIDITGDISEQPTIAKDDNEVKKTKKDDYILDDMPSTSQAAKRRQLYYEAQVKELKKYENFSHTIADISKQPLTLKGNSGQLPIKGIEKEHNKDVVIDITGDNSEQPTIAKDDNEVKKTKKDEGTKAAEANAVPIRKRLRQRKVVNLGSVNKRKKKRFSKKNSGECGRRSIIFKQQTPRKMATAQVTTTVRHSIFYKGSYMQTGDIVSLIDHEDMVYYAQIRGFLVDPYGEKSAFLTWLLPTEASPDPKTGFDPPTYLIGPDEEISRKLEYMEFVMLAPSKYYVDWSEPYPDIEKGEGAYEVQGKAAKAKIQPELNWNCIFDDMPSISQAAKKRLLYYEAQVKELKKYDIFSHTIADISKQPLTLKGNSGQLPIKGIEKEHNKEVFIDNTGDISEQPTIAKDDNEVKKTKKDEGTKAAEANAVPIRNRLRQRKVVNLGSVNKRKKKRFSKKNSGECGRRSIIFKQQTPRKMVTAQVTTTVRHSIFYKGSYMQTGDIVSLIDHEDMVYYAQIRGFLVDPYGEKSAFLTWLLPTEASPDPKTGFDPPTYLIGPDEEISRKLEYMEFVMHAPSKYYVDWSEPYPVPDFMEQDGRVGGYLWTRLPKYNRPKK